MQHSRLTMPLPSDRSRSRTRVLVLLLAASGTLYWWAVVPLIRPEDLSDWGELEAVHRTVASFIKLFSWPACLALVVGAYRAIDGDRSRARQAMLGWAATSVGLVLVMAAFRDPLADYLRTATTHLSSSRFIGYRDLATGAWREADAARYEGWLAAWASGRFLIVETVFCLALAYAHSAIGRSRVGRSAGGWGAPAGIVVTLGLCWAFTAAFGLIESSFDLFHHSIAVGALAAELTIPFFAMQPESAIAAPFGLAYALVSCVLVWRWEARPRPSAPELVPATVD